MNELLPYIWTGFIAIGVTLYVLLDGFSLGLGILYPFAKNDYERDLMMASAAPVWDGNQTWLVGGGAALFCAFPRAFNLLLSALYLPLMLMLIALVFRGVSFEFRFKAQADTFWNKAFWDKTFWGGSIIAAFCQGLVLGNYVQGFDYDGERLTALSGSLLSAFPIFTGIAVVLAYALLASCWLIVKTEGELRQKAARWGQRLTIMVAINVAIVSLWTAYSVPAIAERWFDGTNILLLSPIPIWTIVATATLFWTLRRISNPTSDKVASSPYRHDYRPFLACVGVYLLTLAGLGISLWPYIVPRSLTITEVVAPAASLQFALVGVMLIVPVILLYTANAYYVFRGKVNLRDAYH